MTDASGNADVAGEHAAANVLQILELKERVGTHLGYSGWREVTQEQIDAFAAATGDRQWIHVDRKRAAHGPFGRTVAHGYYTLSLGPVMLFEVLEVEGASAVVNYGLNRLRFPAPVPVGSRVRMGLALAGVEDVTGGVQAAFAATFELEGQAKPACVAEILFRYYA
jgi:acyl dehydratase